MLNEIADNSYNLITKSIPWWHSDLKFEDLARSRIIILINNSLINPTIESFANLKQHHNGLNIKLLELRTEEYIEKLDELQLDSFDVELILESPTLTISNKKELFAICEEETINSNDKVLLLLSRFIEKNIDFNLYDSTKRKILLSTVIPRDKRIELFVQDLVAVDNEFIKSFIITLGNDYYEILDYDKKAKLEDTPLNRKFLGKLISAQFISSYSEKNQKLKVNHKRHL